MKKRLQAMLAKKEARKKELGTKAETTEDIAELRSINTELGTLNTEIAELRTMIEGIPDDTDPGFTPPGGDPAAGDPEGRSGVPGAPGTPGVPFNVLATYGVGGGNPQGRSAEPEDLYATVEYRTAFMKFAKTGQVTPELRVDAMTAAADVSAVIPSTILNEVVKKVTVYGQVFSRVRKLNIKGLF
jgi:HK97 family phage major capsid protein